VVAGRVCSRATPRDSGATSREAIELTQLWFKREEGRHAANPATWNAKSKRKGGNALGGVGFVPIRNGSLDGYQPVLARVESQFQMADGTAIKGAGIERWARVVALAEV